MNVPNMLIEQAIPELAWSLVHFIWQGMVVASVLQTMLSFGRIRSPETRYATCLSGLFVMMICPMATVYWIHSYVEKTQQTQFAQQSEITFYYGIDVSKNTSHQLAQSVESADVVVPRVEIIAPPYEDDRKSIGTSDHLQLLRGIVIAWLCGVGVFTTRLMLGWIGVSRICRQAEPVPEWLLDRLRDLASKLKMPSPLLCASSRLTEAVAAGILKPMILIPIAWTTTLPPDMLEAVIVHELIHLRRRDLLANLFQRLAETLLFYHPAVWWLSRRIRIERELCCDEQVVRTLCSSIRYAETLEEIGRLSLASSRKSSLNLSTTTVSIGSPKRILLQRIQAVLQVDPRLTTSSGRAAGLAMLVPAVFVVSALIISNFVPASEQVEPKNAESNPPVNEIRATADIVPAKEHEFTPIKDDLFVVVPKGRSRLLNFKNRLVKVEGHDADMVRVIPAGPNQLKLEGLAPGLTLMTCTDQFHTEFAMVVEVTDGEINASDESPYSPPPRSCRLERVKIGRGLNEVLVFQNFTICLEFPEEVKAVDAFDSQIIDVKARPLNMIQLKGLATGKTALNVNQGQFTIQVDISPLPKTKREFLKIFRTQDPFAYQDHSNSLDQESDADHGNQSKLFNHSTSDERKMADQPKNEGSDVDHQARLLQSVIERLFPDAAIFCDALQGDTVLLRGHVPDNQTVTQIMDIARVYSANVINHLKVLDAGTINSNDMKRILDELERLRAELNTLKESRFQHPSDSAKTSNTVEVVPHANFDQADSLWSQLGLRMEPLPDSERFELSRTKYRGGLRILEVKAGSPAERGGMKKGDIMVGLNSWETITFDNIKWILQELKKTRPPTEDVKFFVVRQQETRIGVLQLPAGIPIEKFIDPPTTISVDTNADLDKLIKRALIATYERQLIATRHSPWQIMQGVKAFGLDWPLRKEFQSGETITAAEWIASGPKFENEPVWYATDGGARAHPYSKMFWFEGHPGQFLAWLAAAGTPTNFQLKAYRDGKEQPVTVTVSDLVKDLKLNFNDFQNFSWVLWALAYYEPIDSSWLDRQGHQWSIKELVAHEVLEQGTRSEVGMCPRLFGLATALRKYRMANASNNQSLFSPWNEANNRLNQFIVQVKNRQNIDGTFSVGRHPGHELSQDINRRLKTTGEQLGCLAVALPNSEITQDWIERATRVLAEDLLKSKSLEIEVGSMTDAAYGLKLIRERRMELAESK